jgi:septum formation protein
VIEIEQGEPRTVALENALRKARAVRRPGAAETIVACDTIVALDGVIYGKPPDERVAVETIRALGGHTHQVISGLAVLRGQEERTAVAATDVTFKPLDEQAVRRYVSTGEWRDRSGGYAIQKEGSKLVERIDGEIENVVGLPLQPLLALLPELRART